MPASSPRRKRAASVRFGGKSGARVFFSILRRWWKATRTCSRPPSREGGCDVRGGDMAPRSLGRNLRTAGHQTAWWGRCNGIRHLPHRDLRPRQGSLGHRPCHRSWMGKGCDLTRVRKAASEGTGGRSSGASSSRWTTAPFTFGAGEKAHLGTLNLASSGQRGKGVCGGAASWLPGGTGVADRPR